MTHPRLVVLGAPLSAGSYGAGQERTPSVLRRHGLLERLRDAGRGREVSDAGDVAGGTFEPDDPLHPRARGLDTVVATTRAVADAAQAPLSDGAHVLLVGGNCTVLLGLVGAARRAGGRVGVVYVDLDTDLNTPETGDGVLDWMGAAHLLDIDGAEPALARFDPGLAPLLTPADLCFVGVANVTPAEQAVLDRLDLRSHHLDRCLSDPAHVVADLAAWAEGLDRLVVHVDVDVLHQPDFRIAQEQRDSPGLGVAALADLVDGLCHLPAFAALTLCEVNPDRAADDPRRLDVLVDLVGRALAPSEPAEPGVRRSDVP